MTKKLVFAALGALVGAGASVIFDKAQERADAGKPALPSALLASAASLLPLARAVAHQVIETIDALDLSAAENDQEGDEAATEALASAPAHPAGAAYAATPA